MDGIEQAARVVGPIEPGITVFESDGPALRDLTCVTHVIGDQPGGFGRPDRRR
jgi:hypothetical protein